MFLRPRMMMMKVGIITIPDRWIRDSSATFNVLKASFVQTA